jgi:AraC family transcriptional regulator
MDNYISLDKGRYLAPISQIYDYNELLVGVTRYEEYTETGQWHLHKRPMISMVLKGNNLESRQRKNIERIPGSINFYYSHELHKNTYKAFPSMHMSLELEEAFLKNYDITESDIDKAIQKCQYAQLTFLNLLKEASADDCHSFDSIKMLFLGFMDNTLNTNYLKQLQVWIITIRDLLHDRWDENVSLSELSLLTNIHPCTISKYFSHYFQCTMREYVRKLRIEHALNFIRAHQYSLTEVAFICGFSDQSHFTRTFKLLTGYSPKQFEKF